MFRRRVQKLGIRTNLVGEEDMGERELELVREDGRTADDVDETDDKVEVDGSMEGDVVVDSIDDESGTSCRGFKDHIDGAGLTGMEMDIKLARSRFENPSVASMIVEGLSYNAIQCSFVKRNPSRDCRKRVGRCRGGRLSQVLQVDA